MFARVRERSVALRRALVAAAAVWLAAVATAVGPGQPTPMFTLALRPDVQREIRLSAAQASALPTAVQNAFDPAQDSRGATGKTLEDRHRAADQAVHGLLSAEQRRRLRELWRQANGLIALAEPDERAALRTSPDQDRRIQQALAQSWSPRPGEQPGNGVQRVRAAIEREVAQVLTPAQRQAWESRCGRPFPALRPRASGPMPR